MRKIILFALLIAPVMSVWAQTYTLSAFLPGIIEKTVIRELQYPASISYVETQTDHYFVYHDGTPNPLATVSINPLVSVNDFVIVGDTVFFCGRHSTMDMGVFGHFKISQFFQPTNFYTFTGTQLLAQSGHVTSFKKMVSFMQNGSRMIAAIGETSAGKQVVAEVRYEPSMPAYGYTIGELTNTAPETFLDIALTDNYVVTAGFRIVNNNPYPNVRIYPRNSMFQTGGPQDSYTYFTPNSTLHFYDDQLVLSHHQADSFALATYVWDYNTTYNYGTYIGVYKIGTNNTVTTYYSAVTSQYYNNGNWKLRGLTPVEQSSHFYLLQNAEIPNTNQLVNMVFELDNSALFCSTYGSNNPVRTLSEPILRSIDAKSSYLGFVTNGDRESNQHYLRYHCATTNSTMCYNQSFLKFYSVTMNPHLLSNHFVCTSGTSPNFITYAGAFNHANLNVECKE